MAVRKRGGKWVSDTYDAFNVRRWSTFNTKGEAQAEEARARLARKGQTTAPKVDPGITLTDYAARFLRECTARQIAAKTTTRYESALRLHIVPRLGRLKVRDISRPVVKDLLISKLADDAGSFQGQKAAQVGKRKLARGTVKNLLLTLSGVMAQAVEDGLIVANPLQKMGRRLNLGTKRDASKCKALDGAQLRTFLDDARTREPEVFPAFAVMAFAGLRIGEAVALTWENVDIQGQRISVEKQLLGRLKTQASTRVVDMADVLRDVLRDLLAQRRAAAFKAGSQLSPWVLFPDLPAVPDATDEQRVVKTVRRAMIRLLAATGLPTWLTPHALRHTYGSQLIAAGVSPVYVQQQMGHASITMTVDTYGSWLPKSDVGALNKVFNRPAAEALGSNLVATW